jgi:phenylpyruvate tautomerase PptA (4-oxalocrotonate tautomerase family)
MPIVKIEVCRSRPLDQVEAMIEAVYQAQLAAFKLPKDDRQIRYVEHRREFFPVPPGKTENFTLIEFQIFPGRSLAAKRALYQGIVSRLATLGIDPRDIIIVLHEPPLENWCIRGQPASEVDLGFTLAV